MFCVHGLKEAINLIFFITNLCLKIKEVELSADLPFDENGYYDKGDLNVYFTSLLGIPIEGTLFITLHGLTYDHL